MTRRSHFAPSSWRGTHSSLTRERDLTENCSRPRFDFGAIRPFARGCAAVGAISSIAGIVFAVDALSGADYLGAIGFWAGSSLLATLSVYVGVGGRDGDTAKPFEPPPVAAVDPTMAELLRRKAEMQRRHRPSRPIEGEITARLHSHLARVR